MSLSKEQIARYEQMSVLQLREKLKKLNRKRKFLKSQKVDEILAKKTADKSDTIVQKHIDALQQKMDEIFKDLQELTDMKNGEYSQNEQILRTSIDETFEEMKERQLNELTELEIQHQAELLREKNRKLANVKHLENLSIILADNKQYVEAINVDNEARVLDESQKSERLDQIDMKYKTLKQSLLKKFSNEIKLLQEKLDIGLRMIMDQHNTQVKNAYKIAEVTIQSSLLKAINDAQNEVKRFDKNADISAKITKFVTDNAKKNGMTKNLTFD